jgi:hypothetical protein
MAGVIKIRLPETGLGKVPDPRRAQGKRWSLSSVLKACLAGMLAGCKSLAQTEALTDEMSPAMSGMLGIGRRVPDTTARNVLVRLDPPALRACIHRQTKKAQRRKALNPEGLPFGVVAIDGKSTAIEVWDRRYAQRHRDASGHGVRGLVRTLTCSLVSARAKVCIDAVSIPSATNEMGHFQKALRDLVKVYGRRLFQVVSTDAGMCSLENAKAVVDAKKDYLFCIKADQPSLLAEAKRLLQYKSKALAETVDIDGKYEVRRRQYKTSEMAGYLSWKHLRTVLRVESSKVEIKSGKIVEQESRYFISSLDEDRLNDKQWLYMVRQHWAVENQCHNTWDTVFEEDDRPWINSDPKGTVVVMLLRRLAYNMLALFRSVTQRSELRRQMPWRDIIRAMYNAMINLVESDLAGLRARPSTTGYG